MRHSSVLFLLKLKEHRQISQVAINDIVAGSTALVSQSVECIQARVKSKLAEAGLDPNSIKGLNDVFESSINPFDNIETSHLQEKYYREELGLIVSW